MRNRNRRGRLVNGRGLKLSTQRLPRLIKRADFIVQLLLRLPFPVPFTIRLVASDSQFGQSDGERAVGVRDVGIALDSRSDQRQLGLEHLGPFFELAMALDTALQFVPERLFVAPLPAR